MIDYFTEKYNEKRSDGTRGEMKCFHVDNQSFKKKDKIENMKQIFTIHSEINGKLVFKSFRETFSQELESNEKLNKRKLNEFQFVIDEINEILELYHNQK